MMKILITGGAGLIGRYVVDRLVRDGHEVVSIVRAPFVPDAADADLAVATAEILGDATDAELVGSAMVGVKAVVHLAAIPAPVDRTAAELLVANAVTTMTVLEAAGEHGVKTVVLASSISALGMAWADELMHPLYVPVDEEHPLRPTEGYALSKEDDEAAARMAARRWGMTVVALRFPFTATSAMIEDRAADAVLHADQARVAAKELWAYLDVRDAATATELAIEASDAGRIGGAVVLNVIADDVIADQPLADLLSEWHPGVPVRSTEGRGAYSVDRARNLIGFEARFLRGHMA
jgi:nucleoside-diphosphate-sugar epimerase